LKLFFDMKGQQFVTVRCTGRREGGFYVRVAAAAAAAAAAVAAAAQSTATNTPKAWEPQGDRERVPNCYFFTTKI
jgi:hypothetical protein